MRSIDLLIEEHRALSATLDALEAASRRLHSGIDVHEETFDNIFAFCKRFTDGCHHVHEERILFPALAAHGLTPDLTPMSALVAQHESARAILAELQAAYTRFRRGDEGARHDVFVVTREYVTMLRDHMSIEEHYFQSPAALALTPEEDERLADAILSCERGGGCDGRRKFLESARRHRDLVQSW
jgi:hemerythrin-like domain-containing protein